MQLISQSIATNMANGSSIRRMFEAGLVLKKQYGENNVCDFSLGNPDLPPPPAIAEGLKAFAEKVDKPFSLGYMPNGGYPFAREALAKRLSKEQGVPLTASDVMLSCGASGALNALFKATLEPGDEVLVIAPYFVEYNSYVTNHGGVLRIAQSKPDTFDLDIDNIEAAITPKTRYIILNSPNNPTGQVYSMADLEAVAAMLLTKSKGMKRPIFLLADEPYRFLAYDGIDVPSFLPLYPWSISVNSFSKTLSIAGERVGYIALSPLMEGRENLMDALIFCNRILGFVNPPAIGQHLMVHAIDSQVDVSIYLARRNAMRTVLEDAGYEFMLPKGAFYFFPKAPGGDDNAFADKLMKERILVVPGTSFGGPGYFRMAFCVDESVIYRAADGLKKTIK